MAIAFRAASVVANNNTSTLSINKPTGTVDGDIMVAAFFAYTQVTCTAPGGWSTLIAHFSTSDTGLTCYSFYKTASSEGSSYSFTVSATTNYSMSMMAFSGAKASTIRATNTASAITGTSLTSGSVAGVQATDMVVLFGAGAPTTFNTNTCTGPSTSGWATPAAANGNSGDWNVSSAGAYKINGTTAAFTNSQASPIDMIVISCALEAPSSVIPGAPYMVNQTAIAAATW